MVGQRRHPSLTFDLPPSTPAFGPRAGQLALIRDGSEDEVAGRTVLVADSRDAATGTARGATVTTATSTATSTTATATTITIDTPNILVGTVRGVVPHLSRDHANASDAIRWINVPFESFLEQVPPIPTLQNGPHPLHRFLGFDKDRHIASLCLRNPLDTREMPPNGNAYVSANCVRGVKKVTLSDWRQYVHKTQPDVVFALTDTPFTPPPFSQKRITKSIERSATWVADILRPLPGDSDDNVGKAEPHLPPLSRHSLNVFAHMAGGTSLSAREAFAHGLLETLHGAEAEAVKPLRCLDEGISGYTFDLAVLHGVQPGPNTSQHQTVLDYFLRGERPDTLQHPEFVAEVPTPRTETMASSTLPIPESCVPSLDMVSLLRASLEKLPEWKPRLVTGVRSPHEMLHLIRDVGVDLFDAGWAVHAASVGVALDFIFPVPTADEGDEACGTPRRRRSLGHNLYNPVFARQFGRLADTLAGAGERVDGVTAAARQDVCPCIACSPHSPSSHILHSALDWQSYTTTSGEVGEAWEGGTRYGKPYSRAYVHHLLHTHEMSAHTFLVSHNLAVVSAFLAGVRHMWIESGSERFALGVEQFRHAYDDGEELFVVAKNDWQRVDRARGKGRLAREKEKHGRDQDR